MAGLKKFIILSHGRTGSTALCRTLSQHPRIQAYEELFHGSREHRLTANGRMYLEGEDGGAFCGDVVFRAPNETGKSTVGFKIFFFHARGSEREYQTWRYLIGDRSIRVIYLLRKNLFDSFVSEQRSRRSGTWFLEPGERPSAAHTDPIFIDPTDCLHYMAMTTAEIAWARESFIDHENITIWFEDLQRSFTDGVNRVAGFLGEAEMEARTSFERLNTISHNDGVYNYEELVALFGRSIFRSFFVPEVKVR